MLRKLIIAGLTLAAFSAPALSAEEGWNVIHNLAANQCFAAPRGAEPGEQLVSGPFASRMAAERALGQDAACTPPSHRRG